MLTRSSVRILKIWNIILQEEANAYILPQTQVANFYSSLKQPYKKSTIMLSMANVDF